jgi:hypothetical protein
MTPAEIRAIVAALPITAAQLDAVMGAGIGSVSRWQTGAVTPTAPVLRLLRAYADGYRPTDWPHEGEDAMIPRTDRLRARVEMQSTLNASSEIGMALIAEDELFCHHLRSAARMLADNARRLNELADAAEKVQSKEPSHD